MRATHGLLGIVSGRHVGQDVPSRRAVRWASLVVAVIAGVVGVVTATPPTAAAGQVTTLGGRAALALDADDELLPAAPVDEPVDYVALGDS